MRLPIEDIKVTDRLRNADPERVRELAESIRQSGLINPITVDRGHVLVAGLHRLEAVRSLGWTHVPAHVRDLTEDEASLIEIDENLARVDLSPLDRAEALYQRKIIYERIHPNARRRGRRKSESDSELPFSSATASVLGIDERTAQQDIMIATGLAHDVKQQLRRTSGWVRRDLIRLARQTPETQREAMEHIRRGEPLSQALVRISEREPVASNWEVRETVVCPDCGRESPYLHKTRRDQDGSQPIMSVVEGSNADLIEDIGALYLKDGDRIADVTWGQGAFWRNLDLSRHEFHASDLVTRPEAPHDFRCLPYEDSSFDVVVFDPPYMHDPGTPLVEDRYRNADTTRGMSHDDIIDMYRQGMVEAKRILIEGGFLWVKTKDEIVGRRQRLSHIEVHDIAVHELEFMVEDLFILVQATTPVVQNRIQKHSRKIHSYLWVFRNGSGVQSRKRKIPGVT